MTEKSGPLSDDEIMWYADHTQSSNHLGRMAREIKEYRTTTAQQGRDEVIEALKELVIHCWVYSGYSNCGYNKMTTAQQTLFDEVTTVSVESTPSQAKEGS